MSISVKLTSVMKSNVYFKPKIRTFFLLKKAFILKQSLLKKSSADGWSCSIDYETSMHTGFPL